MLSHRAVSDGGRQDGWTEYEVRRMLRQLRRPHSLELHPLARLLADVLGAPSPYDAVRAVVDRAFNEAGSLGKKLRELVYRSDIDGTDTRASVANRMNLSARQYFRYRKEAILLLVDYINALIRRPAQAEEQLLVRLAEKVRAQDPSQAVQIFESLATAEGGALRFSADAVESRIDAGEALSESSLAAFPQDVADHLTARVAVVHAEHSGREVVTHLRDKLLRSHLDSERAMPTSIAFDLARAELVLARHAQAAFDFGLAARQMRSIAQTDASLAFESVMAAVESDLLLGQNANAQSQLRIADRLADDNSARETALVVLHNGALFLQAGAIDAALTYTEAACCALRPLSYERSLADVLAMRARFAMGEPLQNIEAVGFPWRDAYLQALKARECLAMGDADRALAAANEAVASALAFGFDGIAALGLATLAHLTYGGDREQSLSHLLGSWQLFLKCGANTLAADLFKGTIFQNHRLEQTMLQDAFFDAYMAKLHEEFPPSPLFATAASRAALRALLYFCATSALELAGAGDLPADAVARLRAALQRRSNTRDAVSRLRVPLIARAQALLSPWLGDERADRFSTGFTRRLNAVLDSL